jgi:unsaturated rhamnogalacturonyl hydrolase
MFSAPRWLVTAVLAAELMLVAETWGTESVATNRASPVVPPPTEITQKAVLATMKRVANWQLANPSVHPATDWTQGAYYAGMMALASISDDPRYHDAMMEMGQKNDWKPSTNLLYHADNHCVLQTYLELFLQHRDFQMLEPAKQRCDQIMATPPKDENNLDFTAPRAHEKWVWCDALFMSPPVWARLSAVTGDKKYLDFMNQRWWRTSDHLYDKQEHLYYRDDRFLTMHEANGRKVFWGRGNGWVMGGLVRVLQFMPADYPDRQRYVGQFKEMAARLVDLQGEDGLWRASLLDPGSFPAPESSGSGLILYGLAWGVNQKLLTRADYEPSIRKAWQGLARCVDANGRLGFVQPIGANPASLSATNTEVYGTGAFLLAGSEVYHFAWPPGPEPPLGR